MDGQAEGPASPGNVPWMGDDAGTRFSGEWIMQYEIVKVLHNLHKGGGDGDLDPTRFHTSAT
jgi:hypothetical protein